MGAGKRALLLCHVPREPEAAGRRLRGVWAPGVLLGSLVGSTRRVCVRAGGWAVVAE